MCTSGNDLAKEPVERGRAATALPTGPGTYVLVLWHPVQECIQIGRLGARQFPRGFFLYVGSARGGLRGRVGRYLASPHRLHWHVDYMLQHTEVCEIWYREGAERLECTWAVRLAESGMLERPVARFGSSDCRCATHLFHTTERPQVGLLEDSTVQELRLRQAD